MAANQPTQPFATAPTNARFGESLPRVRRAGLGAKQSLRRTEEPPQRLRPTTINRRPFRPHAPYCNPNSLRQPTPDEPQNRPHARRRRRLRVPLRRERQKHRCRARPTASNQTTAGPLHQPRPRGGQPRLVVRLAFAARRLPGMQLRPRALRVPHGLPERPSRNCSWRA
jgi:hypothetical protein